MTNAALRGKPYAGNPHVRFDGGEVAPATTPRRGPLLYKNAGFAKKIRSVLIAVLEVGAVQAFAETQRTEWSNVEDGRFDEASNWTPEATFAAGSTNVIGGTTDLSVTFADSTEMPVNVYLARPLPASGSTLLTLDVLDKVWTLPASATGSVSDYDVIPFAVTTDGNAVKDGAVFVVEQSRTDYATAAPMKIFRNYCKL